MTFQAYLDNIFAKTGKTPEQFKKLAAKAGVYEPDMKANALVAWLKEEFELGHGHSMALWAVFKDKGWVESPKGKKLTGATPALSVRHDACQRDAWPSVYAFLRQGQRLIDMGSRRGRALATRGAEQYRRSVVRSGCAILNSAISGNSGHDAGPRKAWREGVFDGQEVSAPHPAHAQPGVQGAGRPGGPARGQDDGRVVQGVRAAPDADH